MEEKLIIAVREKPILYDYTLPDFKDNDAKNLVWEEIAENVLGLNTTDAIEKVRHRWKTLRDAYVKKRKKTRTARFQKLVRPYKYEKHLKFLLPFISNKETVVNGTSETENDDIENGEDDVSHLSGEELKCVTEIKEESLSPLHPIIINLKKRPAERDPLDHSENFAEEFEDKRQKMQYDVHPVDAFFNGIAATVKNLKPLTIAHLKKEISVMVMDCEINELNELHS